MIYLYFLVYLIKTMMHTEIQTVLLGDTEVRIVKQQGQPGKNFVHLHENELTALETAQFYITRYGGSLISLNHAGTRNIQFMLEEKSYAFDPNRIFTDEGITKTLSEQGAYSPEAHAIVARFAQKILSLLPKEKIIAVHNNYDYSIKSYLPGESLTQDCMALTYREDSNHRNFYFVTQKADYDRFAALGFNVVLQSPLATDDGSLSYCLANMDYINIEAGYEEPLMQLFMLENA